MATKLSMKERAALVPRNLQERPVDPNEPPRTVPGNTYRFGAEAAELRDKVSQLEEKLAKGGLGAKKAPINRLHKVPGRQRNLSPEAKAELLENMRNNPMIEPIVVERRTDGDWDIVSGNNRYDNCIILGRDEVEIFEIEVEEGKGDAIAFYANLIKSTLTDFEKYQGIKKRMQATGMNHREMAEESGLSRPLITRLLSFDRLPSAALAVLDKNPGCVGAGNAEKFAALTEQGRADQVLSAIVSLSENSSLTQERALTMAASSTPTIKQEPPKPVVFKSGKAKFAEMRGSDTAIRISFKNQDDRLQIQEKIIELINSHIK